MPEIVLKNVSKRWGDFVAVDNLNMTVEDRDFITLLGPSGCGKTTTLRMIAGLETPTEGTITIGGRTVFDSERGINISPDKRDIGFLFQNYALWPHMTVYQNISFGLENMKWKKADIKARVDEMLKLLKIEEQAEKTWEYIAETYAGMLAEIKEAVYMPVGIMTGVAPGQQQPGTQYTNQEVPQIGTVGTDNQNQGSISNRNESANDKSIDQVKWDESNSETILAWMASDEDG